MHSKIMDLIFLVQYLKNSECSQVPACLSVWYKNSRVSLRKARKKVLRFSGVNELYDGFRFVRGDKMSMASRDDPAPHCWVCWGAFVLARGSEPTAETCSVAAAGQQPCTVGSWGWPSKCGFSVRLLSASDGHGLLYWSGSVPESVEQTCSKSYYSFFEFFQDEHKCSSKQSLERFSRSQSCHSPTHVT